MTIAALVTTLAVARVMAATGKKRVVYLEDGRPVAAVRDT